MTLLQQQVVSNLFTLEQDIFAIGKGYPPVVTTKSIPPAAVAAAAAGQSKEPSGTDAAVSSNIEQFGYKEGTREV